MIFFNKIQQRRTELGVELLLDNSYDLNFFKERILKEGVGRTLLEKKG